MKSYELTYLISAELTEEEARAFQNKIASLIKEEGGILDETRMPFRRKLAYPIKKQIQAFLTFLNFQLDPSALTNLEKKLKEEKQVLRYLILIRKPLRAIKERARAFKVPSGPSSFGEKKLTEKEKKVELKEIEKKLEEILKE